MDKEIGNRVVRAIEERVFPGCVIGIVRKDGIQEVRSFGTLRYEKGAAPVREDTVYDVASVTKSIPLTSLALQQISEGKLILKDPVGKYLPELKNDHGATIEDLLTYRVAGVQLSTLKDKTADQIIEYVLTHGFDGPLAASRYTNLPAFVLGLIVERIEERSLETLAQERFFRPLRMNNTTFFPTESANVAPTEIDGNEEVCGIPHDESARVFAKANRTVGNAGLFSTAPDILNFLDALLEGDFAPVTLGARNGLGWQLNDPNFMGRYARPHTFGKTGFTGTSVICDIGRSIGFVILSNRTYPRRPPNDDAIFAFRRDVADIILSTT